MMEFNPSKCQVLWVTLQQKPVNSSYTIHGKILNTVDTAKYLGVSIDTKLKFNDHFSAITKKVCATHAFLSRNINTSNRQIRAAAYTSYIRPTVQYASTAWDLHTHKRI